MVEFLHHQQRGGKIPPCHIHLSWWNFSTSLLMVEKIPPACRWWEKFRQERWNFSTICKQVEKFHLQRCTKCPPIWWKFSTISKEVEKYHHGISTCFGGISHHLQAGGTILPYQGKHLLINGVPSVNTVKWCAHQCHYNINNQVPVKSLYRPKNVCGM